MGLCAPEAVKECLRAEIDFTGAPGTLLARYFGESSTLTYGLYSKLEAGLGHAYNELYWNIEGDRTPLLTVTNFSDTTERVDIWATRDTGSRILQSVELPAKASVHINMQQAFTERGADLEALRDRSYGGFFIRAENPMAKVLVKEHISSQSRQVASPYYGSPDIIYSHEIFGHPNWMTAGGGASVSTVTCYMSGCYFNEWPVQSLDPSVVSVLWPPGFWLNAHQPGNATLYSNASGPSDSYGNWCTINDSAGFSVYDATPIINAIVPNTIPTAGSQIAEIYGLNFGTNPTVSATGGILVTRLYHSPTQINVRFDAPATPPGSYNVMVTSNGLTGAFLQAPGGGSQAQSVPRPVGVFCAAPNFETTAPADWADSAGEPAIHKFTQQLWPTIVSFAGRYVVEINAVPAIDGCHFYGSDIPKVTGVSGGLWLVSGTNHWGFDEVGWTSEAFFYYQLELQTQNLPMPCEVQMYQKMDILPCVTGGNISTYVSFTLLRAIISTVGAGSERSGKFETRPLALGP